MNINQYIQCQKISKNEWENDLKKLYAKKDQSQPNNPSLEDGTVCLDDLISPHMVKEAIANLKTRKAPGLDNILTA